MNRATAVTFLMPVWNGREFLCEAIDSVLAQTRDDWLLLVVDDASTDGSAEIVVSYDHSRIRLVRLERNVGQTAAMNVGLELVDTPWVARLDQDDVAAPERLERQLAYVAAHPRTLAVGSWADFIDEARNVVGTFRPAADPVDVRRELYSRSCPIAHSAALFRAEAARSAGGYPAELAIAEDYALWVKLARLGEIANVPAVLTFLRHHPEQTSRDPAAVARVLSEELAISERLGDELCLEGWERRRWRGRRIGVSARLSLAAARAGDWGLARAAATGAAKGAARDPAALAALAALGVERLRRYRSRP